METPPPASPQPPNKAADIDAEIAAARQHLAAVESAETVLAAARRDAATQLQRLRDLGVPTRRLATRVGVPESTLRYRVTGQRATRTEVQA